ncbi:MAG: diguanylate cyclase [Azospirillum sp.]|nr:diguanylate cyclase [Azospirillum sp.]
MLALAAVLAGYPGPAVQVDGEGRQIGVNPAAKALLDADSGWWAQVGVWLRAEAGRPSSVCSVRVNQSRGLTVIEWVAAPLAGAGCLLFGRDATLERQLRQALTESRQRYKDLVEISSDFAWETGADRRLVFVSPRGALGFPADALIGRDPVELIDDYDAEIPSPFATRRPIEFAELWMSAADGAAVCVSVSAMPLFGPDRRWVGARGVCRDITEDVNRADELARVRTSERLLGHIGHTLRDQVDVAEALDEAASETTQALGASGCKIFRTTSAGDYTLAVEHGPHPATAAGPVDFSKVLTSLTQVEEPLVLELEEICLIACRTQYRRVVNGAVCVWRPRHAAPWKEDDLALVAGVADRIGVAQTHFAYQERLRRLSERDGLTGLFNRRTFFERMAEQVSRHDGGFSALLYIDLDNFKAVNDLHGHQQGDAVLKAVGAMLSSGVRPGDLPGRLGGDEFVLWLARADRDEASGVARRLLTGIAELRHLSASPEKLLGLSIGIAVHSGEFQEAPQGLIDRADSAMYAAKAKGKGNVVIAPPPGPTAAGTEL